MAEQYTEWWVTWFPLDSPKGEARTVDAAKAERIYDEHLAQGEHPMLESRTVTRSSWRIVRNSVDIGSIGR